MDPELWQRIEAIFHRAVTLAPAERSTFLSAECRGDRELRMQVERLLAADASPHELVDQLEKGALRPPEDGLIGRDIGAYRLRDRIAVGGMGVVYRAERSDGLFQQEVAVKLIRAELASENMIRRFELERRTLAALQHPNIAHLHDGGSTSDGRPYLVMEFVRGIPIDRYCDERRSTIEERLQLFVEVCRAVHFAHQNLVVHRDLKPGNILVDDRGVPKLLDFGIARLLDESEGQAGIEPTRTGGQILTPEYASPEQLTGGAITTAIDVYALGVVLYELLTGQKPYRSDSRSPLEWHRAVVERAPTRPSNMVLSADTPAIAGLAAPTPEELAARRGTSPRSLRHRLRGDLDRIVLMALRKEPERRYASVKDFADDIERHFSGHPVLARGDSLAYIAQKFVQRNRLAVISAVAVLATLILGIVFARRGEERAEAQAEHARIEAESFEGIAGFLMDAFLTSTKPLDEGELAQKRQRIRMHAAQLRRQYVDQDHLRANLLDSLGRVALRLGLSSDAEELVQEALTIRRQAFGEQSLEHALSLRSLGLLRYSRGELAPAAEAFGQALELHRTRPKETHTDVAAVANDLAACLRGLGRLEEAEALHREALALRRAAADGSLDVAESLNNYAGLNLDRNELAPAAQRLEEALAIRRRILGPEDPLTLQSMSNLATTNWRLDRREAAHALLLEVESGYRALQADGEEGLAQVLSNRAGMLIAENRLLEAEAAVNEALALQTRRLGPTHPGVAATLTRHAQLQEALGHVEEARSAWERVVAIRRAAGSPRYLAQALCDQGNFLWATKAVTAARAALSESVAVWRSNGTTTAPALGRAELALGIVLLASDEVADARKHLNEARSIFEAAPAGTGEELARVREALKRCEEMSAR